MTVEPKPRTASGFLVFALSSLVYLTWTASLGGFREIPILPRYGVLAQAFLAGHTWVAQPGMTTDFVERGGRAYLYFGPAPALLRLPLLAFGFSLPTGAAIALFAAFTTAAVWALLRILDVPPPAVSLRRGLFLALAALNGYTLLMTTIPSIHHEAILCSTGFLLAGLCGVFRAAREGWRISAARSALLGACFGLALASRFSCLLTVTSALGSLLVGTLRAPRTERRRRLIRVAPSFGLCAIAMAGLLAYNASRFEHPLEFGYNSPHSVYGPYHTAGNYFRYDHVPFNVWSYFFQLPRLQPKPPYVLLPFFLRDVREAWSDYHLLHGNEACASVFMMLPVLLLGAIPFLRTARSNDATPPHAGLVLGFAVTQIAPLMTTVAATARYCLDFLPLLIVLAALGARAAADRLRPPVLVLLAVLSLLLSEAVLANGMILYDVYFHYRPRLLDVLGP